MPKEVSTKTQARTSLNFVRLSEENVRRLSPIIEAAFDDDTRRFKHEARGGPPGYDDGTFLRKWGLESATEAYAILENDIPVGGYIVWWRPDESRLGALFLDPRIQNRGVGQLVWRHIENTYPTKAWILDTPVWSVRCHHFYERCGFVRRGIKGDQVVYGKKCI